MDNRILQWRVIQTVQLSKAYFLHLVPKLLHNECEMISYLWTRLVLQGRLSRNTSFTLKNAKDPKTGQQQQTKKRLFFSE